MRRLTLDNELRSFRIWLCIWEILLRPIISAGGSLYQSGNRQVFPIFGPSVLLYWCYLHTNIVRKVFMTPVLTLAPLNAKYCISSRFLIGFIHPLMAHFTVTGKNEAGVDLF